MAFTTPRSVSPKIRGDRMPVIQFVFRHNEFAVGIKHNEIRIIACGYATLVRCRNRPVEPGLRPSTAQDRAR